MIAPTGTYVASDAKTTLKSAQQVSAAVAAVSGPVTTVSALPRLPGPSVITGGSERLTAAVSSHTNQLGTTTVNHGITAQQSTGIGMSPGFPDEGYNAYFRRDYPGYVTGVYSGVHGGARHSYFGWAYPGLSGGFYPGFYYTTGNGFLNSVYPGLPESAYLGLYGGAYSRYGREMHPGLFGWAYRSLYGPGFFSYGASRRVRTYAAQEQGALPGVPKPGLGITNFGATASSRSQLVGTGLGGSAVVSGAKQAVVQAQTGAI